MAKTYMKLDGNLVPVSLDTGANQLSVRIDDLEISKQDKLIAGDNITIDENNVISSSSSGGGGFWTRHWLTQAEVDVGYYYISDREWLIIPHGLTGLSGGFNIDLMGNALDVKITNLNVNDVKVNNTYSANFESANGSVQSYRCYISKYGTAEIRFIYFNDEYFTALYQFHGDLIEKTP